ncbi:FAD-dependent oxidoreductase [Pontibacter vulgaris]|uniref:FAD-dependent oxidoreductase n=1 Tax=Pontibacter vulgaris TaxID=2905679 RepID=UPI001FA76A08|nr:NAD(P)/FAD-dependent oxidoreductase [Pontibacter vulgaris]
MTEKKNITIMGAGLVGSLLSLYLAKRGHKVDIYERRPDMRKVVLDGGRSINLALSDRGWRALKGIGIEEDVRKVAIPMYGRMMHDEKGNLTYQPYGKEGQAIYSVSRAGLNMALMDLSEPNPDINYHFNRQLLDVNLRNSEVELRNTETGEKERLKTDLLFGADGAFSMLRNAMQKTERYNYSQSYLEYGYKELTIPPAADGSWQLAEKNALHIWPRGNYMMIALPNIDGSFTCTLFFPFEGERSFAAIKTDTDLLNFFLEVFPDAVPLMPDLAEEYFSNPIGSLVTIKCFPWSYEDKALLIGDACHAVVPFYGQGMNAGFEDITVLDQMLENFDGDWEKLFKDFERKRKPDADAIADLAVMNFIEMRDEVANSRFLLRKKIEGKISEQYPDKWLPLYSMVTFSDLPYSYALETGRLQEEIMRKVMKHINSEEDYSKPKVQQLLEEQIIHKEKLKKYNGGEAEVNR